MVCCTGANVHCTVKILKHLHFYVNLHIRSNFLFAISQKHPNPRCVVLVLNPRYITNKVNIIDRLYVEHPSSLWVNLNIRSVPMLVDLTTFIQFKIATSGVTKHIHCIFIHQPYNASFKTLLYYNNIYFYANCFLANFVPKVTNIQQRWSKQQYAHICMMHQAVTWVCRQKMVGFRINTFGLRHCILWSNWPMVTRASHGEVTVDPDHHVDPGYSVVHHMMNSGVLFW